MLTNPEFVARLAGLYRRGYTLGQIGQMRGVRLRKDAVRKLLADHGHPIRHRGIKPKRHLTTTQYLALVAQHGADTPELEQAVNRALVAPLYARVNRRESRKAATATTTPEQPVSSTTTAPAPKRSKRYGKLAADEAAVVLAYQNGESGYEIAQRYGVNARSVYLFLDARGIARRPRGNKTVKGQARVRRKLQEHWERKRANAGDRNADVVRARTEEHLTYSQLGERFGVSRQRIAQILRNASATKGHVGRKRQADTQPTQMTPLALDIAEAHDSALALIVGRLARVEDRMVVIQSGIVALLNEYGIIVMPDGTVERMPRPTIPTTDDARRWPPGAVPPEPSHPFEGNGTGPAHIVADDDEDELLIPAVFTYRDEHGTYSQGRGTSLPVGWRYMTDDERLHAWAARGGSPPPNLVVRDDRLAAVAS